MSDENCCGACGYPIHATKDKACDWCCQTADRIEALTEQLKTVLDREAATTARYDAKTDELEVKLAKAMGALRDAECQLVYLDERRPTGTTPTIIARVRAAIAALKGGAA
jgi:hypothetical protein